MKNRRPHLTASKNSGVGNVVNTALRIMWSAFILSVMIYAGGFLVFIAEYQRAALPTLKSADAIVVLTGGPDRIGEAVKLLADKHAPRLFISGVNEQTDEDDLIRTIPALQKFMTCCVTIDRDATNTHENAVQTIRWAKRNNYKSIILVTSHAHLPRALFEFRTSGGEMIEISPWRVGGPENPEDWWHDTQTIRAMLTEYTKLTGSALHYFYFSIKRDLVSFVL